MASYFPTPAAVARTTAGVEAPRHLGMQEAKEAFADFLQGGGYKSVLIETGPARHSIAGHPMFAQQTYS